MFVKMKKLIIGLLVIFLYLSGCSASFEPELTRIDVQQTSEEGLNDGEDKIIATNETLKKIQQAFDKVKWSPTTKVEMARKEDVIATFFIQEEKSMPESLYQYRIWFEGETATIISEKENEGYGRLTDKEQVEGLESILLAGE